MILHIGADVAVASEDVLMILNLNAERATAHTEYLAHMRSQGRVRQLPGGNPKCAVVVAKRTRGTRGAQVLLSPVNTATILKRDAQGAWQD